MWHVRMGLAAVVSASAAVASAAEANKVAIVDQQAIVERSAVGKKDLESLKEFSASRQKILASDENEIRDLEKELQLLPASTTEAVKTQKQEKFRAKYEAFQKRVQQFQQEIQNRQKELQDSYSKKIGDIAAELAQKQGYVAVIDKGNEAFLRIAVYAAPAIDLTDQVVKEMDRRYK